MDEREPSTSPSWHALGVDDALQKLGSGLDGLSSGEAHDRLSAHGPNLLQQAQGRPWWKRLLEQFNNILMVILLVASVASLGLGHALDAAAILGVVLILALIGFVQ